MSDVRCKISLFLLLLLFTLTAAAQDFSVRQGCRRGTPRPQSTQLRRGGSEVRMPGGDFYHGERHQLVVLAAYSDRSFKDDEAATMEQWNKIFNAENLTEAPFCGSIHDYFLAQSYGVFNVVFDFQYVLVSGNAKKYASTSSDDENSQYLVQDIIDVLKTRDIDWSLYDWNGDGFVNQLLIIYAGHGMNDSSGDVVWPHQWWMSNHLKDRVPGVYCEPIPVTFGGKDYLVDCYCALAELTRNNDYGSFGTICHEYSHCFGFPDFYGDRSYLYNWDIMDRGNYNGGGYRPPGYSAHERWLMGWLEPIELKENTTITDIPALADEGRAYLIRNDGYENEYYIVENRQAKGWDTSLPGSGIVVFHIDYDPSIWTSVTVLPNTTGRMRYDIFHANNSNSYSGWSYPYESNDLVRNDSLTNTSTPAAKLNNANTDDSKLMNKSLYDMRVEGGLSSFRFAVNTPTAVSEQKTEGRPQELYRLGPVSILRYPNGTIKKVVKW